MKLMYETNKNIKEAIKIFEDKLPNINTLLRFCTENKCSDLYIKVGEKPYISKYGLIYQLPCYEVTIKIWQEWANFAISSENNAKYVRQKMLDFSYTIPINIKNKNNEDEYSEYRYRVSAGFSFGKNTATFRMISTELPSFENINFPKDVQKILEEIGQKRTKITMIVGATGSGKSIYYNQNVILKNGKNVKWTDIKIGDEFIDNSKIEFIADWEYRPCFELATKNTKIIVSDEHLIKCHYRIKDEFFVPSVNYNNKILNGWADAQQIYELCSIYNAEIILDNNIKLENITVFDFGFPQKCRCIKTNTGQYQIGDFINHNTTTMAACINDFSKPGGPFNNSVIISLEDPIEYVYNRTNNVNIVQKELGTDFKEFNLGVKQALREHPNFINVGETRDKETINTLVEASRTGHAVYTSFHATDVGDTISRLYNYLIGDNQEIMYDLIANMNLIICQKLQANDDGFKLLTQYMIFNDQIIKYLSQAIDKGRNIPTVINELMHNETLLKYNLVKDWS